MWPGRETGVHVCTMHASKGLEDEAVYIPDVNEGNIPWHEARTKEAVEEERRLLYVGMTRAKKELYLLWTQKETESGAQPSRFLQEAGLIEESPTSNPEISRI